MGLKSMNEGPQLLPPREVRCDTEQDRIRDLSRFDFILTYDRPISAYRPR